MKICIYTLSPLTGGGIITKSILLINFLIEKNHEVDWAYPKKKGEVPKYIKRFLELKKINTIEIKAIKGLRVLDPIDFFRQIKKKYDIYQVISGYCSDGIIFKNHSKSYFLWVASTINSEKGIKNDQRNIFFIKKLVSYLNIKLGTILENYSAKRAYKIFSASNSTKKKILDEFNLPEERVKVMYPIIDTQYYDYKSIYSRSVNDDYILYMGIFSHRKNIDLLIEAFSLVNKENKKLKLKLVGKTNGYRDYFQNMIDSYNIQNVVEIVGEVKENKRWYQNAVCTVSTSLEEGFGMVLAESLSCGTPVISTNSGGVKDIVLDGINGYLLDHDPKDLANCILKLYNNIDLRSYFSKNGRKHVIDHFSMSVIGNKFISEYEALLKRE